MYGSDVLLPTLNNVIIYSSSYHIVTSGIYSSKFHLPEAYFATNSKDGSLASSSCATKFGEEVGETFGITNGWETSLANFKNFIVYVYMYKCVV